MYKNIFTLIAFVIFTVSFVSVKAQTAPLNIVTTSVPFLRITPDARASGMGDIGIATTPDAYASFWNVAKSTFAENKAAIGVSYTPWLRGSNVKDIYLVSIAGYYQLDKTQAITGSFRYFNLGSVQFTDEMGNNLNSSHPNEFAFDAGYTRKLTDKLALGIALRYIHSNLASGNINGQSYKAGNSVSGDISVFHDGTSGMSKSGLNWGATITNLGSKISYTSDADQKNYIPANLGLGIAYTKIIDEDSKISFGLDVNKLLVPTPPKLSGSSTSADSAAINNYRNKGVISGVFNSFNDVRGQVSGGAEYTYQHLTIRGGYFYESPTKGDRKYFTVGAGINLSMLAFDFSYLIPTGSTIANNPLQNTIRTSLLFNLEKK